MGVASVLNIAFGLAKMKVAAVLLGPAGVGLIGLYQNLIQTGSTIASLGIAQAGTRQIAAAKATGGPSAVDRTRRALFWGMLILSILGGLLFFMVSRWTSIYLLDAQDREGEVAWLSIGVMLTVVAAGQTALLTGMRRTTHLALIQVTSGLTGAVIGIFSLWQWGQAGLIAMLLSAPAATLAVGYLFTSRLPRVKGLHTGWHELLVEWRCLSRLGIALMLSALVTTLSLLAVRGLVRQQLGQEALGHFQASWSIGMTYLGFVLTAMATDYFPRLSAVIRDKEAACRMVNEQTEMALMLCGPVLLAMFGLAPWVVQTLYSSEFSPASDLLRWQIAGDILKVLSWPLGFTLLAAGAGKTFVLTEAAGMGVFVAGIAIALPWLGLTATGVSFVALYAAYLPAVYLISRRLIGFRWSVAVKKNFALLSCSALLTFGSLIFSPPITVMVTLLICTAFGVRAFLLLRSVLLSNVLPTRHN